MRSFPSDPPTYRADLFVNRQAEINFVVALARLLSQGQETPRRTIVFHGERGIGKTWLSLHLTRTVLPRIPGVVPLLIRLGPSLYETTRSDQPNEWPPDQQLWSQHNDPLDLTTTIVRWVAANVAATITVPATIHELTSWLVRDVERHFTHDVLALILDSVFEADWEFLQKLETHLLAPLASLPRVLIIMTGRGRPYPWVSPYLRVQAEDKKLEGFQEDDLKELLQRQAPGTDDHIHKILEISGGRPLSAVLIASNPESIETLRNVIQVLLSVVPQENRDKIRRYLEALCLLDGFRESEIPPMLAAYFEESSYEHLSLTEVRKVRDELVATQLLRWENGKYAVDQSIRSVLMKFLQLHDFPTWQRLHCRAYRLYQRWAELYTKSHDYYHARSQKHADELSRQGIDPETCLSFGKVA